MLFASGETPGSARAIRVPRAVGPSTLPDVVAARPASSVIVGRSAELGRLDLLLDAGLAGEGGRCLVAGDPGIGKTALLDAVARRAKGRGFTHLRARGVEGASGIPCGMVVDLWRNAGQDPVSARDAATWGDVVLRHLCELAQCSPVLLIVDDAHFADGPSLAALAMVAERAERIPIVVLAAVRSPDAPPARLATWPRLEVGPLATEASIAILRSRVGADRPAPVSALVEACDGNPLALTEVARLLTAEQVCGQKPLPRTIPIGHGLRRAWAPRIDRLSQGGHRALVDVAVAGSRPEVLAALAPHADWCDEHLDELVAVGLAAPGAEGPPTMSGLVRSVVIDVSPPGEIRAAHRRAAEVTRDLGLPPRLVLEHLVQCSLTCDAQIASALEDEAHRAESLDLLGMASDAWLQAARLSISREDRTRRALCAVRLVMVNGLDYADTDGLLALLAGADLDEESTGWVEWLAALQRSGTDPDAALVAQWAAICRARVSSPQTVLTLLWDTAMNAWTLGNPTEGLRAAREFAEIEGRLDPQADRVEPPWTGTALVAAALFQAGRVAESVPLRRSAILAASDVDPTAVPFDRLLCMVFLDDVLLDDSPASSDRVLVAMQRMLDESAPLACLYGIQAWRARARGDWATALDLLTVGRPIADATGATGPQLGMTALAAELAGLRGEDDTLQQESCRLRDWASRQGDRRRLASLDRALGLRELADGRLEAAITSLTAAADCSFLGRGLRDGVLPARVDVVEALVRLGRMDEARARADVVSSILHEMADPAADALMLRMDALLAPASSADDSFAAALAAHERSTDPFERARCLLLRGEHLRRSRQRSLARGVLLDAERVFDALGARPWLQRTRQELRAAGGQPDPGAGLEVLTAQELAVARAVAQGRSNREVAELLFLSPKTVEYHLGSAYRKLGVHGRAALTHHVMAADAALSSASGDGRVSA